MTLTVKGVVRDTMALEAFHVREPSVTRWQRLEAEPRALDLQPGLQAQIADPLWLVGRQWQLAELKGEDAGSPIRAELDGEIAPLQLSPDSPRAAEPLAKEAGLIEPVVEAERARAELAWIAAEGGLDFERVLALYGMAPLADTFRSRFPFTAPASFDAAVDAAGARFLALTAGRAIDAMALANALRPGVDAEGRVATLPEGIAASPAALDAASEWLRGWDSLLYEPAGDVPWLAPRLEYAVALQTEHAAGVTALPASEYHGKRLDWWSFDAAARPPSAGGAPPTRTVKRTLLPAPIRFPGMPAERYWAFEDGSVNLAQPTGGPASIALMLVLEYELVASNDWFQLPLELPYGSAFRLSALRITDTFGRVADVPRANTGAAGWAMFDLAPARGAVSPPVFALPSVTAEVLESAPIEEAVLFRDEMANLVWGVERRTPGLTPTTIDRASNASAPRVLSQRVDMAGEVDAGAIYRLQTRVPLHWYPFTAELQAPAGAVELVRRSLVRLAIAADGSVTETAMRPQGRLLGSGRTVLDESEVPRSGLVVTRTFQHARTADGQRVVWVGRRKRVGRGEGASDLRYDVLEESARAR